MCCHRTPGGNSLGPYKVLNWQIRPPLVGGPGGDLAPQRTYCTGSHEGGYDTPPRPGRPSSALGEKYVCVAVSPTLHCQWEGSRVSVMVQ